jgi:hypothetical protein
LRHRSGSAILRRKARVQSFFNILKRVAAVGAACALASAAPQQKKFRDQAESDIYTQVIQDAADPVRQLAGLDSWNQRYPDSEYKEDRAYLYMQAWSKMTPAQPAKVVEYGAKLLSGNTGAIFDGAGGGQLAGLPVKLAMLNVLYSVAINAAGVGAWHRDEIALGEKAARQLLEFAPKYFTSANRPANQTEADWMIGRAEIESRAKAALLTFALMPGFMAQAAKDCRGQEAAFGKALSDFPDSGAVLYQYGLAMITCGHDDPEKLSRGIWKLARAASLDPVKSGLQANDRAEIDGYLKKIYTALHGSEDGLSQLEQQAATESSPWPGFRIKSAKEITVEKEAAFQRKYPQLATWMAMKRELNEYNGEQYFQGQLKDATLPMLKGALVEARPACRPKELLVALPQPDTSKPYRAEITVKLDKPLAGQPEPDSEFQWQGVAAAFTREPFMLIVNAETAKLDGLKTTPCATTVVRPGTTETTARPK